MDDILGLVSATALARGYTDVEVRAGREHFLRKARAAHPPGEWDKAGRFYASERSSRVLACRSPSRRWSLSQMKAARTAAHCAEVYGVEDELAVRRVARALKVVQEVWSGGEAVAASAAKQVLKLRPGTTLAANAPQDLAEVA